MSETCEICRDPNERVTAVFCRHVAEGEEYLDADGDSLIVKCQADYDAIPAWLCPDADCPEFRVCGECGSNVPLDVKAALARQVESGQVSA